jgi:hypothetical protein
MLNQSKPTTTIGNTAKPVTAIANAASPYVDPLWTASVLPWALALPWQVNNSGITNVVKPV